MLFILRNPIERIYSYFNFHSGHLAIPAHISFEDYLNICRQYEMGNIKMEDAPFDAWHLGAVAYGRYSEYLWCYLKYFTEGDIKVMFFDDLQDNPRSFMKEISKCLAINECFYDGYSFKKINVTFSSKIESVHKLALLVNRKTESFLRQRPALRSILISIYKCANMEKQGYEEMLPRTNRMLHEYYADSNQELMQMIGRPLPRG